MKGLALLALVLLAGAAAAQPRIDDVHSPSVASASHAPAAPARGEDVRVRLALVEGAAASNVTLTYCRVENYACAPPVRMQETAAGAYEADIAWRDGFFRGVKSVGYAFILRFADESSEHSPTANWPKTPDALPKGLDVAYYFYELPAEKRAMPAPGLAWSAVAVALGALALGRRRG